MTIEQPYKHLPQSFESFPKLAGMIEDLAWKMEGVSIAKWGRFLGELNATIDALRGTSIGSAMTLQQFLNGVRVLWNIDRDEFLACINAEDREEFGDDDLWAAFAREPHKQFAQFPTQDQVRIFAIITERNRKAGLS